MKNGTKYGLSADEKAILRKNKVRLADIQHYTAHELEVLLDIPKQRAKEIYGLAEFQTVPSVGVRFAEDLLSIGYYSLDDLKHKDGPSLIHELELSAGVWIDPCVEDQCRLVVHYANNKDKTKNWWDFTLERKAYRAEFGYLPSRPLKAWYETLGYTKG